MSSELNINHYPLGDNALVLAFSDDVLSKETNKKIQQLCALLDKQSLKGIIELVPAFTTLTIYYDPLTLSYQKLVDHIYLLSKKPFPLQQSQISTKEIPVLYNGEDLEYVASYHNLSVEEVINIHSQREYIVYMLGFTPGFPYLGGMDKRIATPRKDTPRLKVLAGSVGIGGNQTGVYTQDSPAGWQIIGHTPISLFDIQKEKPALLQAGDIVRFIPITSDQYQTLLHS